ncbi:hypothetical protein MMC09_003466 [Bachmanniomyces sp. S44760]|nr:hypothetical protein [Bachmanniomyces sp. S44760]
MTTEKRALEEPVFGGSTPWISPSTPWTAVDDRVRGGSSHSNLANGPSNTALFSGTLDIKTLGGAGFASQTTSLNDKIWDLGGYDGLEIVLGAGDGKRYTLILKDELPEGQRDDGREKSGVNWEYDLTVPPSADGVVVEKRVFVRWGDFKPTYRGREMKDAKPLKTRSIRKFSFMMRRCVLDSCASLIYVLN